MAEKKNAPETDEAAAEAFPNSISQEDFITDIEEKQEFRDDGKYEALAKPNTKGNTVTAVFYPETYRSLADKGISNFEKYKDMTDQEILDDVCDRLAWTGWEIESILHDKCDNPDGSHKKNHGHIIVRQSSGNTTYRKFSDEIRKITLGPYPLWVRSVLGMHEYLYHKNNPEKYQYDKGLIKTWNGFRVPLGAEEKHAALESLIAEIIENDIDNYGELLATYMNDVARYGVIIEKAYFFKQYIKSYRANKRRCINAYVSNIDVPRELRQRLRSSIDEREQAEFERLVTAKMLEIKAEQEALRRLGFTE